MMSFLLWTLALTVVLLGLRRVVCSWTQLRAFKLVFFPGVFVAILARSLACGFSQTPLKAVHLPWRAGEPVEHEKPGIPVLGHVLISVFPLMAGFLVVLILKSLLVPDLACEAELRPMEANIGAAVTFLGTSVKIAGTADDLVLNPCLHDVRTAAFVYLAFSVLVFTAPFYWEWKVLASMLGCGVALLALLDYLGVRPGFLSLAWCIQYAYGDLALASLALVLMASLFSLIVAAATCGSIQLIQAMERGSEKDKKKPKK